MKKTFSLTAALTLSLVSLCCAESLSISKISDEPGTDTQQMELSNKEVTLKFNVIKQTTLTEKDMLHANLVTIEGQGEQIELKLTEDGKKNFKILTGESIGKQFAIIYNGSLISAPMIHQEISGGNLLIMLSENFTKKDAVQFVEFINKSKNK